MKNKTCGECQWYDHHHLLCVVGGDIKPTESAKDCFVSANPTNGDRIRQMSNEELREFLKDVNQKLFICNLCAYDSTCCVYDGGDRCNAGMIAWLNAPAGKDTNVPANESEVNNE